MAMRGFGAPEVADAYDRAEFLCKKLDEHTDLFPSLWGQWLFRWGRSQLDDAEKLGERLLVLGASSGKADLQLQAHHAMWATMFGRGNLVRLRAHAEAGFRLYDPARHRSMASRYGNHDAFCCGHKFLAMSLALGGDAAASRRSTSAALQTAHEYDEPFSLALTHYFGSVAQQMMGDTERCRRECGAEPEDRHGAWAHCCPRYGAPASSAGARSWKENPGADWPSLPTPSKRCKRRSRVTSRTISCSCKPTASSCPAGPTSRSKPPGRA